MFERTHFVRRIVRQHHERPRALRYVFDRVCDRRNMQRRIVHRDDVRTATRLVQRRVREHANRQRQLRRMRHGVRGGMELHRGPLRGIDFDRHAGSTVHHGRRVRHERQLQPRIARMAGRLLHQFRLPDQRRLRRRRSVRAIGLEHDLPARMHGRERMPNGVSLHQSRNELGVPPRLRGRSGTRVRRGSVQHVHRAMQRIVLLRLGLLRRQWMRSVPRRVLLHRANELRRRQHLLHVRRRVRLRERCRLRRRAHVRSRQRRRVQLLKLHARR